MIDTASHWDFEDPAASRERFQHLADSSTGLERDVWLTQVARAHGLEGQLAAGHEVLDGIGHSLAHPEVAARTALERGRLLRSAGQPAREQLTLAADIARDSGLDALSVDALHLLEDRTYSRSGADAGSEAGSGAGAGSGGPA